MYTHTHTHTYIYSIQFLYLSINKVYGLFACVNRHSVLVQREGVLQLVLISFWVF